MARKNSKEDLVSAVVFLVARQGHEGTTIRAISRHAGVTEAAVYRHFQSKDELYWFAYKKIIGEMIHEKEQIFSMTLTLREKLSLWIELTYRYYDQQPEAFTYVLLTNHNLPQSEQGMTRRQGELFCEMFAQAKEAGKARKIPSELALSHFGGLMLNVPRLINEGRLKAPAIQYTQEVLSAVCQALQVNDKGIDFNEPRP